MKRTTGYNKALLSAGGELEPETTNKLIIASSKRQESGV